MAAVTDATDLFYPSEGINGYGAQIEVGDGGSPEVFEAIAFVKTITPGEMSTGVYERTHLRSPDAHKEKGAGLRDSGPFVITGTWVPTNQSQSNTGGGTGPFTSGGLVALWRGRAQHNFKIILNDGIGSPAIGTEWPFRGIVTKFQPGQISGDNDIDFTAEFTPVQAYDAALP
jgi:hypothetical protein